jgi:hypothetical protein
VERGGGVGITSSMLTKEPLSLRAIERVVHPLELTIKGGADLGGARGPSTMSPPPALGRAVFPRGANGVGQPAAAFGTGVIRRQKLLLLTLPAFTVALPIAAAATCI